ncbi:MAG: hypothetical protein IT374_20760, partial [Polyangiaceae bacterium]|nr:hypothetical protein [Polyangiaceae bacterium]
AEGLALGEELATVAAIEALAEVLGVELTAARRAELSSSTLEGVRARLASLRAQRAWT